MTTALFVGRFQPFHTGHMKDVKDILEECDNIIICIGSADKSRTADNPFSHTERRKMIEAALNDAGIGEKRYTIVSVTDIGNNDLWVGHVEKQVSGFDIVYTGNSLVSKLFRESGYTVKDVEIYRQISSSNIRKRMALGMEWKKYVPNAVAYYLGDIGAEDIVKRYTPTINT